VLPPSGFIAGASKWGEPLSASLEDACLAKADIEFALMDNVVLRGACLTEADISGAQLDAFQMHEEAQTADLLRSLKEQLLRSEDEAQQRN
jgi:uncharacterized protein YjbI with pentapeptide repeats